ncbi:hypothetical protein [Gimibacter soli]|uniref:DUF2975 domain-containing protein n=1 Tax=Gimibacter soli TaxID=3024400 RepID=A0AAF0BGI3_9PROT|nr:hypothetical protein [Gimibacter soli]WCL53533.1 hypothetical protein PH603_13420 [Gimibacter soli]
MPETPDIRPETPRPARDSLYRWTMGAIWFLLVTMPLANLWFWIDPASFPGPGISEARQYAPETLGAPQRIAGFLITSLSLATILSAMWHIKHLIQAFEAGLFFAEETVSRTSRAARMLFLYIGVALVSKPMLSVALTLHKGPGARELTLTIGDSGEWVGLLVALVLLFFARALEAARRQSDELAEII